MQDKYNKLPKELEQYVKEYVASFNIPDVKIMKSRSENNHCKIQVKVLRKLIKHINAHILSSANCGCTGVEFTTLDLENMLRGSQETYFEVYSKETLSILLDIYQDKGYTMEHYYNGFESFSIGW